MSLNVPPPDPPELDTGGHGSVGDTAETDEYRRRELETFLREGAWEDAWDRWTAQTDLSDAEYEIARDLGLFGGFDFFWDDFADRVGYHAPGIPEDWRERELHPDLDSWEAASAINAALTELGQVVSDVLKDDYVSWESAFEAPDDLPDFGAE